MKKTLLLGLLILTLGLVACEPEVEEDVNAPTSSHEYASAAGGAAYL